MNSNTLMFEENINRNINKNITNIDSIDGSISDININNIKSVFGKEKLDELKRELIEKKIILVICGPTCTGKTKTAFIMGKLFDTDIISVDSMQAFKGMDIGTDKQDLSKYFIKQYMIDICEPDHNLTAVEFRDIARNIIESEFFLKSKIPLIVGGSGLHLRAILDNLMKVPQGDAAIRKEINEEIKRFGLQKLYENLYDIDKAYAEKISPNDKRRIIRALEVFKKTGKKYSDYLNTWNERKSIYNSILIGFNADRKYLYENIRKRVNNMISLGLVEEVRNLVNKGYKNAYSMQQAIGYKEIIKYLDNEYSLEKAIEEIEKNTRHLAKKQNTWFKADKRINWVTISNYSNTNDLLRDIIEIIYKQISNF